VQRQPSGALRVTRIVDLQIVNGGQTTASLFRAVRKDKAEVSRIAVQVKLNRVRSPEALDELVGRISKFANSQNKVNVSDLSANDPFNQRLEELSRTTLAPAAKGSQLETKWFYERARAQYADGLASADGPVKKSKFEREFPKGQLFTKTDLAKYELSWSQHPWIVSRGAQKCFVYFKEELDRRGGSYRPDENFFRHLVALKIMFDAVDRIVLKKKYSYKAQVVAYTLALLSFRTARRFDFDLVWNGQAVPDEWLSFFDSLVDRVHPVVATPVGGANVTNWYKSEDCWRAVQKLDFPLPAALQALASGSTEQAMAGIEVPTEDEEAEITWARSLPADVWFGISAWAKKTDSLASWQRSIAVSLGRLANQQRPPSRKQAAQGRLLHDEAIRLGFVHENVDADRQSQE
jgi:hypothetical protein